MAERPFHFNAIINYELPYVQELILEALKTQLPPSVCCSIISSTEQHEPSKIPLLQIQSYEALDFSQSMTIPCPVLINAFVIRKALIRKHYLSSTIDFYVRKYDSSILHQTFEPAVSFELDYAEFLDEALDEAFELRQSLEQNSIIQSGSTLSDGSALQWWILKPGMSDAGNGIRLFSTEDELRTIFEEWDEELSDEDGDVDEDENPWSNIRAESQASVNDTNQISESKDSETHRVVTSHLRHFVAQKYIQNPLLIAAEPFKNRKFHIRTYVIAIGALEVYVYKHMLALFASKSYEPPWQLKQVFEAEPSKNDLLERFRNIHLTNTCVQTEYLHNGSPPEDSVHLLSNLPLSSSTLNSISVHINEIVSELFKAAVAQPTNFQPLPRAFEIYGIDFLLGDCGAEPPNVYLLEVNAFPDFAQTGPSLRQLVVGGLFEEVVRLATANLFAQASGLSPIESPLQPTDRLTRVLHLEMGR